MNELNKYLRCPSKMLKAKIVCETTCKDRRCLYHPDYRERSRNHNIPKRDIPDPFIDSGLPTGVKPPLGNAKGKRGAVKAGISSRPKVSR